MDSYYYLEPGFDSKKLTIAQLTSILSKHDVKLPGTHQRKYVYLELFDREIKANASKLLDELNGVVPSDTGIKIISNELSDEVNLKHSSTRDDSPVRKRIKPTFATPQTVDTQSMKAPSLERFFVSPSLPGIRSKIKTRVAELKEFWDSQSTSEAEESLLEPKREKSLSCPQTEESLSEMYNVKKESNKQGLGLNSTQCLTLITTILVWGLLWFLGFLNTLYMDGSHIVNYDISPYIEMIKSLGSANFYKVICRSIMQMFAPSVFFLLTHVSTMFEYIKTVVSDLDPVLMYSAGGLWLVVTFGIKE